MEKILSEICFGVLTVSDRAAKGERQDVSGPALRQTIEAHGGSVVLQAIVADEQSEIIQVLRSWCDEHAVDVILTTGGTGCAPRDVTPEATLAVLERSVPGIGEAIRAESLRQTPHAMLSRGIAGIRNRTLIINLPGSPKGAVQSLEVILPVLPHAVQLLREDPRAEEGHLPS
ncbi:MAG: MogA/MoaB family molybdenum cofactor biosynthesis protein [Anaerolineales bacterium]|nr:MogA/MoaB family molybdenum cofactor biosynthesis protein [Anaerolineales bacterium]MDW8160697.1 MogA/MoaB family molybdenum cofactor biosynthesis protein [Anaerolineales bacterium]